MGDNQVAKIRRGYDSTNAKKIRNRPDIFPFNVKLDLLFGLLKVT